MFSVLRVNEILVIIERTEIQKFEKKQGTGQRFTFARHYICVTTLRLLFFR